MSLSDLWGCNVADYRHDAHLTQTKLAALCGVTVGMIQHIEQGRRLPSPDLAARIAEALNADGRDLFPL